MEIQPVIRIRLNKAIEVRKGPIDPFFAKQPQPTYRAIDWIVGIELDRPVEIAAGLCPVLQGCPRQMPAVVGGSETGIKFDRAREALYGECVLISGFMDVAHAIMSRRRL